MNLNLKNRLVLLNLLPVKGNFEDLIIREDVVKKIGVSQEEVDKYGIKTDEKGRLTWQPNEDSFSFEFSTLEMSFIKRILDELNEKKELTVDSIDLFRAFKE